MRRRDWLKKSSLMAGTAIGLPNIVRSVSRSARQKVLTVAHITDIHIRPENEIPARFKKCLREMKNQHSVDFILNGGDTIHAADYSDTTRESVLEQWQAWDDCRKLIESYDIFSCLGNHDMWWAAPDKDDSMYGKNYVVERLGMPSRYYSFKAENWHFIVLDGNHDGVALDEEQYQWLEQELEQIPEDEHVLLMSHHPILGVSGLFYPSDHHSDFEKLTSLFYKHKEKVKTCISGHMHLLESAVYNDVTFYCNGAMSGFWWGDGNEDSAGTGYYRETPPGYAILHLYSTGDVEREYIPHSY